MGKDNFPLAPFLGGLALNTLSSYVCSTTSLNQWIKYVNQPKEMKVHDPMESSNLEGGARWDPQESFFVYFYFQLFLTIPSFIHSFGRIC